MDKMKLSIIQALSDNYIYAIQPHDDPKNVRIIDAGEAAPVIDFLTKNDLNLKTIYITHHHFDHTDGIKILKEKYGCEVIGPEYERPFIKRMDKGLKDGDHFTDAGIKFEITHLPGHTSGHIGYYLPEEKIFFSGDTLFSLGCGRIFEGTPDEMWQSLKKIRDLPNETNIYAGHEYTLSNAEFVLSILGETNALKSFLRNCMQRLEQGLATYPTTVAEQKQFNPFFMADQSQFASIFSGTGAAETFKALREKKDHF